MTLPYALEMHVSKTSPAILEVMYTNHHHERRRRAIFPIRLFYGTSEYYRTPQWLLEVIDEERGVRRTFALARMEPIDE